MSEQNIYIIIHNTRDKMSKSQHKIADYISNHTQSHFSQVQS